MSEQIKAVLFDLGDTLMYSPHPWPPVYQQAALALSAELMAGGVGLDEINFDSAFLKKLDDYYVDRDRNLLETSTIVLLEKLLTEHGFPNLAGDFLRAALDAFYTVTEENWLLEEDALETVKKLHELGYRLGLVSNAGDDKDVLQLVEKFGIGSYFDFVLTSASCGYRKPHPQIFKIALTRWGYLPDEVAMVGDRLDADIGGAGPLGLYTIWIRRRSKQTSIPKHTFTRPDSIVDNLAQIPDVVIKLN